MFAIPQLTCLALFITQLADRFFELTVACRRLPLATAPKLAQAVYQDAAQPSTKGARPAIVLELGHFLEQNGQHFLNDIIGILWSQALASQSSSQPRLVYVHEALPCWGVLLKADAFQQAERSCVH